MVWDYLKGFNAFNFKWPPTQRWYCLILNGPLKVWIVFQYLWFILTDNFNLCIYYKSDLRISSAGEHIGKIRMEHSWKNISHNIESKKISRVMLLIRNCYLGESIDITRTLPLKKHVIPHVNPRFRVTVGWRRRDEI